MSEDPLGFGGGDLHLFTYADQNPLIWVDVTGLWKSRGHSELTLQSLPSGYFAPADIERLIAANTGVDIMNPFPGGAHYMPGSSREAERYIERMLCTAVQHELRGHRDAALFFLGVGLHALQDRYAHHEQDAGWWAHSPGGIRPDDPALHPYEYSLARAASTRFLRTFIEQVNRGRLR